MRVLVYPHDLELGGSQLNAVEIASRVAALGHHTVIFGRQGALVDRIAELGLPFELSPDPGRRPSIRAVSALLDVIDRHRIDVVHGYEWPPALEAAIASTRRPGIAALATVMSMAVAPFLPQSMPLIVGTEQIAEVERRRGRLRVDVLEPPVDLAHNQVSTDLPVEQFRQSWGLSRDRLNLVCVTRLANELKLEGLLTAIETVGSMGAASGVRLVIVGDGPARSRVADMADLANRRAGEPIVVLTGQLSDPRPAYAAADICLGMGGSALRSLAFGKPLVVQGENGYFELLTQQSLAGFLWQGWYGYGDDPAVGSARLRPILDRLVADPALRQELGQFGQTVVESRFSLDSAAERQIALYEKAIGDAPGRAPKRVVDLARSATGFASYKARRKALAMLGRRRADDFNANPVAKSGPEAPRTANGILESTDSAGTIVYFSGAPWHAVAGTDQHLARALGAKRPVLWVDPPVSIWSRWRRKLDIPPFSTVAPGVRRIHTSVPPGVSRPVVRTISRLMVNHRVRRVISAEKRSVSAILVSSPEPILWDWRSDTAKRLLFMTDDFVSGASLLGSTVRRAQRSLDRNVAAADLVLAVTQPLADSVSNHDAPVRVFPNGCDPDHYSGLELLERPAQINLPEPIVGVFGQLNERIDLDVLERVIDANINLLLVGPRYEVDAMFRRRLDLLIARPNVQWVDRQPFEAMPSFMKAIRVGLVPYRDNDFNRASFPLKTLDYLAGGRMAVSTDLPAARWLNSPHVYLASTPTEFVDRTMSALQKSGSVAQDEIRASAAAHSWAARSAEIELLLEKPNRVESAAAAVVTEPGSEVS